MIASCGIRVHCGGEIEAGQRWVREKAYERAFAGREPRYHRYHTELFERTRTELLERHLLQGNSGRLAA
jgi:hypothetical protein